MNQLTVVTDPGIDDLISLLLLSKLQPNLKTAIVSTFGNIPEKYAFQNIKEFITLTAKNWPIIRSAKLPLLKKINHQWLFDYQGKDGVRNIHFKTKTSKLKIINKLSPTENIISLASLTSVYKILKNFRKSIKEITVMGGAFKVKANYTNLAECNIFFDPKAASLFFSQCQNINVKVVPLDVTNNVVWPKSVADKIPEYSPINRWIKGILLDWYKNYFPKKKKPFKIHDPLAVYLTFFPNQAIWQKSGIKVNLKPGFKGRTTFDKNKPVCKIAMYLKDPAETAKQIFKQTFY